MRKACGSSSPSHGRPRYSPTSTPSKTMIDTVYDLVDLKSTWENVDRLDRNSDRFLQGVKSNGERMKP